MFDIVKMGIAAISAAIIAYQIGQYRGYAAGYDKHVAIQAAAAAEAELKRKNDDAKLSQMSDFDLCVAYLGGRGLPIEPCEQLRGI